jgi:hypothetical protein
VIRSKSLNFNAFLPKYSTNTIAELNADVPLGVIDIDLFRVFANSLIDRSVGKLHSICSLAHFDLVISQNN